MQKKLSICIPTYNRCAMLKNLLESILIQLNGQKAELVEIAVSDNASDDGTQDMVANIAESHPECSIIYHRNEENTGADRNYLRAVEISHGEYAWMIGSDDMLEPDVLDRLFLELEKGYSVYIAQRDNYDFNMEHQEGVESFFKEGLAKDMLFELNCIRNWDFYFNSCISIGGVFSYLSSTVFRRSLWNSAEEPEKYTGTAYVHAYILLKGLLKQKSTLKLIGWPLVKNRRGNDSFRQDAYQRMMLDFDGYLKISRIFNNPLLRDDFLGVIRRYHRYVGYGILLRISRKQYRRLYKTMQKLGYDKGTLDLVNRIYKHKFAAVMLCLDKLLRKENFALIKGRIHG